MPKSQKEDRRMRHARAVKARHEDELMARRGVIGVGVGLRMQNQQYTEEVAIIVMIANQADLDPDDDMPAELEGVPVDVQITGTINAQ